MTSTPSDRLGFLLGEVIRELPEKATVFLGNVGFVIEDEPPDGPRREAEWHPSPLHGNQHLSQYWCFYPPTTRVEPLGRATLYARPILEAGCDPKEELRRVLLRLIEAKQGVDPGTLDRPIAPEAGSWQEEDGEPEFSASPELSDASEDLVQLAETEIEPLPAEAKDWFDEVDIVAVEQPEAEGDPARLADYPEPGDDPMALVLYTRNILGRTEPPAETVRGILREALQRAGVGRA
ncbi:MAG: hypothetical protein IT452_13080 [Planctomycetia bacterium]|nr:hypothetical protein [Planctomycetia bacterium]